MASQDQIDKFSAGLSASINKSTNGANSELRFRDICNGKLPASVCNVIGQVAKDKGIAIIGNPNAIVKPRLKFDKNGNVTGGSINIEVRF